MATGTPFSEAAVYASFDSLYVASYNPQWTCEPAAPCVYSANTFLLAFESADNFQLGTPSFGMNRSARCASRAYLRNTKVVHVSGE